MFQTKTVTVPHLDGISASYHHPRPLDHALPTLVLINSFTTSAALYESFYTNDTMASKMNLLAIELLGHGQTRTKVKHWTYWDTAMMNVLVLKELGIRKAVVLGTSQGGWVTVRMALLEPEMIQGIIPLGTSLDAETPRTRELGCWDPLAILSSNISQFSSLTPTPDFNPGPGYANFLVDLGFGKECDAATRAFWVEEIQANYAGDEGRERLRMASINLRDRDGLHERVWDVKCPVLWMHGTSDAVYSVANAKEEIQLFVNSPDARLEVIEGGQHFLSASNPVEVSKNVLEFVTKYGM